VPRPRRARGRAGHEGGLDTQGHHQCDAPVRNQHADAGRPDGVDRPRAHAQAAQRTPHEAQVDGRDRRPDDVTEVERMPERRGVRREGALCAAHLCRTRLAAAAMRHRRRLSPRQRLLCEYEARSGRTRAC